MNIFLLIACSNVSGLKEHNVRPTVNIYSHEDGVELIRGEEEIFLANVVDLNDSVQDLTIEWYYGEESVCPEAIVDRNDDTSCQVLITDEATEIKVVIRDSSNTVGEDILEFTLKNRAPSLPNLRITPERPTSSDDIQVTASSTDEDFDVLLYEYSWSLVDNPTNIVSTVDRLTASQTERGQFWKVEVVAFDGTEYSRENWIQLEILNSPPVIDNINIFPQVSIYNDSILNCLVDADDPDSPLGEDIVNVDVEWYNNNSLIGLGEELSLDYSLAAPQDTIKCVGTVEDSQGASITDEYSVTIENREFTVLSSRLLPVNPTLSDSVEIEIEVIDDDLLPLEMTYNWFVNSVAIANNTPQLNETLIRGDQVDVEVLISDGIYSEIITETAIIQNSAPELGSVGLTPNPINTTDNVYCIPEGFTDLDGDAPSYIYSWYINNTNINLSANELSSDRTVRGDQVYCEVVPSDGLALGNAVVSTTIEIENTPPSITSARISPSNPTSSNDLECIPEGWNDADDDALEYDFDWTVDGVQLGLNTSILDASAFEKDQTVACTITPNDQIDAGTPIVSQSVLIQNSPPTTGPVLLTPDPAFEGSLLNCATDEPSDRDQDVDFNLVYEWVVNGERISESTSTLDGTHFNYQDTVSCSITPDDGNDSGVSVESNTLTISNTPPTATAHTSLTIVYQNYQDLICELETAEDPDEQTLTYSVQWSLNGTAYEEDTLDSTMPMDTIAKELIFDGDEWECTITVTDGVDSSISNVVVFPQVQNPAPSISSVSLTPQLAYQKDTLLCTPSGWQDIQGHPEGYFYEWVVNETPLNHDSSTLDGSYFERDQQVYCIATPDNGTDTGTPVRSDTITIQNSIPTIESAVLSPDPATSSDTLNCTANQFEDEDGDAPNHSYTWFVNDQEINQTSAQLSHPNFTKGNQVSCEITPFDGTDFGIAKSSEPITIDNSPPILTTTTISPSQPTSSTTLECVPSGEDIDNDPLSYEFDWNLNGTWLNLNLPTLSSSIIHRNDEVTCLAIPKDGTVAGTSLSSITITVGNTPPTLSEATLTPEAAFEATELNCSPGDVSDEDEDLSIDFRYEWFVNGGKIDASAASLTGIDFDYEDQVYCSITPDDGIDSGVSITSNTIIISNTPPTVNATVNRQNPVEGYHDLICQLESSDDVDQHSLTYTVMWIKNDDPYDGLTETTDIPNDTILGSEITKGERWECIIIADDGIDTGSSPIVLFDQIQGTEPSITSVSLSPEIASESSTLTCSPQGWFSIDDASEQYIFDWTIDGASLQLDSATIDGTYFNRDQSVFCTATPTDGVVEGNSVESNSIIISNTAPELDNVTLTPDPAYESSTLTCNPGTISDDDQDTNFDYDYEWDLGGGLISNTSATLTGSDFDKGDEITCYIIPTDGTSSGEPKASNTITIENSPPTAPSATASPSSPFVGSHNLRCVLSNPSNDDDGDYPLNYQVLWKRNGSTYTGATSTDEIPNDTVPASSTSYNDQWRCSILVDDGTDSTLSSEAVFNRVNDYCSVYVSQTCYEESEPTIHHHYGRHASCGVNSGCTWCCNQDYIDDDCEGWCTGNCPNWHAEYYNECAYTTSTPNSYEYECGYYTTQPCH